MALVSRLRARYHYWVGLGWRSRGNHSNDTAAYQEAIGAFTQAIAHDPAYAPAHYARGVIYWRELNDFERAIRDFSAALAIDDSLADAYLNRGLSRIYGRLGTREDAVSDFEQYLRRGKSPYWRIEAQNQLARLHAAC